MADAEIGIWKLTDGAPQFFERKSVQLEKQLEDWLERDGGLIQAGLCIVGRQVHTPVGILDLLAVDRWGRWSVIEIKRGSVRRETLTQALDYAAYLADITPEALRDAVTAYLQKRHVPLGAFLKELQLDETIFNQPRDIQVYVVGTGRDESFDRLAKYTKFQENPVNAVTFSVYENSGGERLLLRELTDLDTTPTVVTLEDDGEKPQVTTSLAKLQTVFAQADHYGCGQAFRLVYEAATSVGLYAKLYSRSIMFAPMRNRNRMVMYMPVKSNKGSKLRIYIYAQAWAEFYPVTPNEVIKYLGKDGDQFFDLAGAQAFAQQLKKLFELISKKG
ncbi:MAG: DUF91 domain-containing protein [Chloroflexi bacterium]|nr:DUF91 domain-containing protein [Chloroflexota bacterium]